MKIVSRRMLLAVLIAACLTVGTVTGVAAFEPPSDPANVFTCDPTPVLGHPASRGLEGVVLDGKSIGPWNAVFAPHGTPMNPVRRMNQGHTRKRLGP